mmetsp:Transcript_25673/g.64717  ORF Transcript_25673/g.64717 Transcript_25673/m.64717 type:complete len:262 (-) Transcript_25673:202-987(-)|eukprot:CAMPEP_0173458612 /NCGR_PEP_ID=MMETSP1357-20121228/59895_1 /TAXON_ID=77926 /ORGANISM="Hemiselmis rufescens, Strain PCC563" /LENGTH=261 /DNA_ID=CAMNT_0014425991 /DNA_START=95 /DNA_END=880 /DNA_ORIENTATION=-
MPEYRDPWDTRGRPRASMKAFTGIPWKGPTKSDADPRKPAEWFGRYKKTMNIRPASVSGNVSAGLGQASNFVQTELNPGVAFDKTTKKFRLLLFENGMPKPMGSFFTDEDGMQAYGGYHDFYGRGPHGVTGVELSRYCAGPPGAAILTPPGPDVAGKAKEPDLNVWKMNMRTRPPRKATTSLLKEKGQWYDGIPDFSASCPRPDMLNATTRSDMHTRTGELAPLRGSRLTQSMHLTESLQRTMGGNKENEDEGEEGEEEEQ